MPVIGNFDDDSVVNGHISVDSVEERSCRQTWGMLPERKRRMPVFTESIRPECSRNTVDSGPLIPMEGRRMLVTSEDSWPNPVDTPEGKRRWITREIGGANYARRRSN